MNFLLQAMQVRSHFVVSLGVSGWFCFSSGSFSISFVMSDPSSDISSRIMTGSHIDIASMSLSSFSVSKGCKESVSVPVVSSWSRAGRFGEESSSMSENGRKISRKLAEN